MVTGSKIINADCWSHKSQIKLRIQNIGAKFEIRGFSSKQKSNFEINLKMSRVDSLDISAILVCEIAMRNHIMTYDTPSCGLTGFLLW